MAVVETNTAASALEEAPVTAAPDSVLPVNWTLADVQEHLGGIPLDRIMAVPPPGMATHQDVVEAESRTGRICELVDGILVAKTMGWNESALAVILGHFLFQFVNKHRLGMVLGEAGTLRILPDQVRAADLSVIRWDRFGAEGPPRDQPIPPLAPDLAVEILSRGNAPAEMERKLREYFQAGVRLVWYIDPRKRTVDVYTATDQRTTLGENGVLTGVDVLPGFELRLAQLFALAEESGQPE